MRDAAARVAWATVLATAPRGGAVNNPAPRSARGLASANDPRPRRRPLHVLAQHFVWPPPRPQTSCDADVPRAERGAALSGAPPRATASQSRQHPQSIRDADAYGAWATVLATAPRGGAVNNPASRSARGLARANDRRRGGGRYMFSRSILCGRLRGHKRRARRLSPRRARGCIVQRASARDRMTVSPASAAVYTRRRRVRRLGYRSCDGPARRRGEQSSLALRAGIGARE
jgi:hypothetical protein